MSLVGLDSNKLIRLGRRVRIRRRSIKWTQSRLAEEAGLSRAKIQRLENGDPGTLLATYAAVNEALEKEGAK